MDKLLLLKGKLEMAKRTIQLQKASGKKQNALLQQKPEPLVYKDGDAGDSSDEGSDGNEQMDEDNSSSEEEIKEIPLRQLA